MGAPTNISQDPSINSQTNPPTQISIRTPQNIKCGSRDVDVRIWIKSGPRNNFLSEWKMRSVITKIIKTNYQGAWKSWSSASKDVRDFWFNDFMGKYKWLIHDDVVVNS
ncbi:unnamed protein product [Lathyrus oleraceus]